MNAEAIARALSGRKCGRGWMAPCVAHDDAEPSLSIRQGANDVVLVYCHAGCPQARVIAELTRRGMWGADREVVPGHSSSARRSARHDPDGGEGGRIAWAVEIWLASKAATGTLVEKYLRARGIEIAVPSVLRYCRALKHPSGTTWPAMAALVVSGQDGKPVAIHRTFLSDDGLGKAPVEPKKMMLGPCRGGVVRLAPVGPMLMIGEGIETCLAAMQATRQPAWAALSTNGLRTAELPRDVLDIVILADGDDAGETAALDAARRWKRDGRRVRIARPPSGLDFNDLLTARSCSIAEEVQP